MIDIDATVLCKRASNTVEIHLKREKEDLLIYEDGNVVNIGSGIAPPFPIPHLLLNNIDPQNMYPLLYSTLQDPILCDRISVKVASEAERVSGPLYISLHVTLTPKRFIDTSSLLTWETSICAICLEEGPDLSQLPNCLHEFHIDCIMQWLSTSFTCPLCRAVIDDYDEDHPYYSS